MTDQNKTREGLILELQKLQQKQYLLESLYNKSLTERKQEQAKLKKTEERYAAILAYLNIGLVIHAPDTSVVINNSKASELLGISDDLLKGKKAIDPNWHFLDENAIPIPIEEYPVNKIARSKKIIKDFIVGVKHPATSNIIWVSVNGFPVIDKKGEISEITICFIDITQRKKSEQSLQASKDYLDKIINSVAAPIFVKDDTHRFCLVNDSLCAFLNLKRDELIGKKGYEHFPEAQFEVFIAKVKEASNIGKENIIEELIKDGHGKTRTVVTNKTLYTDNEGNKFLIGVLNDVSELKQAEIMLKDEKELLSSILEMVKNPIFLKDKDRRVIFANRAFFDFFGLDKNSVIGKTMAETFPKEQMKHFLKLNREVLDTGTPSQIEEEFTVGSKLHTIITNRTRLINKSGEKFLVGTLNDVTEFKQVLNELIMANTKLAFQNEEKEKLAAELIVANKELAFQNEEKEKRAEELIFAKEKAEESDRLKSAFLANMSHEIRTPMNGILGFAGLLKEPGLSSEKQQKYIKIIEKSGDRMLNIINNIVDISKIESGLMKVYIKETNINEQVENIYNFFKPEADAKVIQLSVKKSLPEKEANLKTDAEKINAILNNLVKNAIKFTNQGTVELGVDYVSSTNGHSELKFFVKDTGIGIPKDRQKAVFERFIQADISDKMAMQGAGLGLSIAKAFAEMLGGKIWVESEKDIGSIFYFTLPYNREPEEKIASQNNLASKKATKKVISLKILIAEDDETAEIFLSLILEEFSSEIFVAKNGIEAVEICRNNPDLDLILMDIQMPEMSGYEATEQIRQFNKEVIIIAQTAYGFLADREKALKAGCNDYIAKPIKIDELIALVQKYFN